MHKPSDFPKALTISFIIVTILNEVFAGFSYLAFGANTQGIVTANLGTGVFVDIAKVALVLDLLFTYLVVFVAARDIVEHSLVKDGSSWPETKRSLIRAGLVGCTVAFAVVVTQFQQIIGLVAGLAMSFMSFILPPMIHISMHGRKNFPVFILHLCITIFGFVAAISTTWESLIGILIDNHVISKDPILGN